MTEIIERTDFKFSGFAGEYVVNELYMFYVVMSLGSPVSVVTEYRLNNHAPISTTTLPTPDLDPRIQNSFLPGIKRLERESYHSHLSSAIIQDTFSRTSMPSISFTCCAYHNNNLLVIVNTCIS